jgi:hypothetical protein
MNNKKKILFVNGNQFGYSSGHYYYCKYLKDKFEIEYVCYDRGYKMMYIEGVGVSYIPFKKNKIKRVINFIRISISISKKIHPDVLFVVYFNLSFILALFCPAKFKILDIRTGSLNSHNIHRSLENAYLYMQVMFFQKVIILSDSLRKRLHIKQEKTLLMPLGSEIYYSGIHDFSLINLLYIGGIARKIYQTIEGIEIFLNQYPEYKPFLTYTIIGYGKSMDEKEIIDTISRCKLKSFVSYEGMKNYEELTPYFQKHNFGVAYIPMTRYFDVQPTTKIYEYALSGLFTIATATYENKRLINKTNGILCDDNPHSFAAALKACFELRHTINSELIRNSLKENEWRILVESLLYPVIYNS